jgi:hypothetical protein
MLKNPISITLRPVAGDSKGAGAGYMLTLNDLNAKPGEQSSTLVAETLDKAKEYAAGMISGIVEPVSEVPVEASAK